MSTQSLDQAMKIGAHERAAVQKRLAQISVALGHPRMTSKQSAALVRERASLERMVASVDSNEDIDIGMRQYET